MTVPELVTSLRQKQVRLWLEGNHLKYDAPAGVITAEVLAELKRRRNDVVEFLSNTFQEVETEEGLSSSARGPQIESPLSFAQEGMWFVDQVTPSTPLFNLPIAVKIEGTLRVDILERALSELVQRHESLRTVFRVENDLPIQIVRPSGMVTLSGQSLDKPHRKGSQLRNVRDAVATEAMRPFDLENGPPFRAALFRVKETSHVLVFTMHHLVSDGWSLAILQRELRLLYDSLCAGRPYPLPPLPIQYRNFVKWQRDGTRGEVFSKQLHYWVNQLKDVQRLDLVLSRPRPALSSYTANKHAFIVPSTIAKALDKLSKQNGATLFMTLLSSFAALLARLTGHGDIAIGVPIAGRNRLEFEDLVGLFVNILVMRIGVEDNASFSGLLRNVRTTALEAYTHQDVSFERLVAELCPEREPGSNPLVQVMFAVQNAPSESLKFNGLKVTPLSIPFAFSNFDLELHFWPETDILRGLFVYRSDLFDRRTISRMVGRLCHVLSAVTTQPDILLSDLPIVDEPERRTLVTEYAAGPRKAQAAKCLHSLFEEQALRSPKNPAVICGPETLQFNELDEQSNKVARFLKQWGVETETPVAICMTPSLAMIIGLIGILKAGGAYVPLDPNWPAARLRFVLQDSNARIGLTQHSLAELLCCAGLTDVFCLEPPCEDIAAQSVAAIPNQAEPENLAYIIYTSGSSGVPKGVMIEHRAVSNLLMGIYDLFYREHRDPANSTLLASFAFDSSVEEIFATLVFGHCLHIVPDDVKKDGLKLMRFLIENEINICCCAPAHLTLLAEAAARHAGRFKLEHLHVGGEALRMQIVNNLFDNWGSEKRPTLINSYGPTECCVEATSYVAKSARGQLFTPTLPIGKPLSNIRVYVVDRFGDLAPTGVPGELCIGGAGLARGYVNAPQLTAEKFVQSRFAPHERIYRTGDLVRWLPSRDLEFLGRTDEQVKIRGFRIEPAEIDCLLAEHPAVLQSVTLAGQKEGSDVRLVTYVTLRAGHNIDREDINRQLRNYVQESLPTYMVPAIIVVIEKIPLTTNGKIDRKALPEPQFIRSAQRKSPDLITATEQTLIKMWSRVFNLEVEGSDNFFELGGHSLLATRIVSMIRSTFGVDLSLREFLAAPSLSALAGSIDDKTASCL